MPNYIDIDVDEIIYETDKAVLVRIGIDETWIPLSQIEDGYVPDLDAETITLQVPEWFAEKEGLI